MTENLRHQLQVCRSTSGRWVRTFVKFSQDREKLQPGMLKVAEATLEGHKGRTKKKKKHIQEEESSKQRRSRKVFQHTHQFYMNLIIRRLARGDETTELHKSEFPKFQHHQEHRGTLGVWVTRLVLPNPVAES